MRCNPDGTVGAHTAKESAASTKLRQEGLRGQPAEGPCPAPPPFQATGAKSQMSSQAPRDTVPRFAKSRPEATTQVHWF